MVERGPALPEDLAETTTKMPIQAVERPAAPVARIPEQPLAVPSEPKAVTPEPEKTPTVLEYDIAAVASGSTNPPTAELQSIVSQMFEQNGKNDAA